jgi:predicted O-linked N-acetylglucosamine transferase (SPINDLY family)
MHARPGLLVFARKPAPVQITYLHYVGTTGLEAIDWRISTSELEPQTLGFVEKPLWLPAYFCYKPSIWNIEPGPPPSEKNGFITFGSLNAFKKAGATSRRIWAKVMSALPDSRMIVHASEGSHREEFLADMQRLGIASQRFEFVGLLPIDQYMAVYRRIDVCLDTFPYAGGTTTCDALWMGVPVITLAGTLPISRMGAAILPAVGLMECVCRDEAEYVAAAINLTEPQELNNFRSGLRETIKASPSLLFDAQAFARSMEAAYRRAWHEWCHRSS